MIYLWYFVILCDTCDNVWHCDICDKSNTFMILWFICDIIVIHLWYCNMCDIMWYCCTNEWHCDIIVINLWYYNIFVISLWNIYDTVIYLWYYVILLQYYACLFVNLTYLWIWPLGVIFLWIPFTPGGPWPPRMTWVSVKCIYVKMHFHSVFLQVYLLNVFICKCYL